MATIADNKIVSLVALKRYNHNLITKLGLTNDTALYAYTKYTGTDKATQVKLALDQLYDLVDSASAATLNAVNITDDKSGTATVSLDNVQGSTTTSLATFDVKTTDDNLTVTSTAKSETANANISLDLNSISESKTTDESGKATYTTTPASVTGDPLAQKSYVDLELEQAEVANATSYASSKAETSAATYTFTQDGSTGMYYIHATVGSNVYNLKIDGTAFLKDGFLQSVALSEDKKYLVFTWNTDASIAVTQIAVADIIGNLQGGDGIDISNGTISVDLANQSNPVKLLFTSNKLDVSTEIGSVTSSSTGGVITWASDTSTGLATSQNVADVANNLQDQIEALSGQHSVVNASTNGKTATTSDSVYIVPTAATKSTGTVYTVTYATCTSSDIDELFGIV